MSSESSNLVTHALGGGDGDLVDDALVGVEVEGEAGVVLLDDRPGGLLDGLGADSLLLQGERVENQHDRSEKTMH